jgi:N-acetylmuramoyl-L-alanine amidase
MRYVSRINIVILSAFLSGYMYKAAGSPNPTSMDDTEVLTRTLMGEARGQGAKEMKLVMDVIFNRAVKRNKTLRQVALANKQFSTWNPPRNDRNYKTTVNIPKTSELYQRAQQIVSTRRANKSGDWTGGATHFYNPKVVKPRWTNPSFKKVRESTHVFGTAD